MLSSFKTFQVIRRLCEMGVLNRSCLVCLKNDLEPVGKQMNTKTSTFAVESDKWDFVRSMFAFDDDIDVVPINAANLCPNFDIVQKLVNLVSLDLNKNCAIQKRVCVWAEVIDDAREKIAKQLNVSPAEIAFVRNTTEANNAINNGLDFADGDEIVLWEENHGTNKKAWEIRKQRYPNLVLQWVKLEGADTPQKIVAKFMEKVSENTRVVTFSYLSNESGLLLPAKDICTAVHERFPTVHVHVDGAQTWGAMSLDLADMGCDSFGASAHKWFVGPKEAGLFFMKLERITNFWPNNYGYDSKILLPDQLYDDARRFETLGQRNDATLIGLLYTAELLEIIKYEDIGKRIQELVTMLYDGLVALGFPMTTPADKTQRHGVVVAGVDPEYGEFLYDSLYKDYSIAVSSTGGLRICPHLYNTEEHIQRVLDALQELKR